jgi:hypothetical protein
MAIIEPVALDSPLTQGDLLQGISLYSTDEWKSSGGKAVVAGRHKLCLVISRPCVTSHKDHLTVVNVEQMGSGIPDECKEFDQVLGFLQDVRDGAGSPDVFYLGELPGKTGRYCAKLDSFHDIRIPTDPVERTEFLQTCRIGRLDRDFVNDLHERLFRAFASLGFDDVKWFSDDDLKLLINAGRVELAKAEGEKNSQELVNSKKQFIGKGAIPEGACNVAAAKVETVKKKLAPFIAESDRRDMMRRATEITTAGTDSTTTTT